MPESKPQKQDAKGRPPWDWLLVILLVMGALAVYARMGASLGENEQISYTEFRNLLTKDAIKDVVVGPNEIHGTLKPTAKNKEPKPFSALRVDGEIAAELEKHHVTVTGEPGASWFESLLSWLLPPLLLFGMWMLFLRPAATGVGGLMGVGQSRAKLFVERELKVTFADVAGVDEAKQELAEVVGFLKNPEFYGRLGARIPKGVLLVGPPGTGKTLLARAVAGEAKVPFLSITGSEFVEMFVGVGAARVRDLFAQARAGAPAIVFIDELDALGRARGVDFRLGGHDEKEQTLNQLLAEMDGFDPSVGIVVLAATNRPEILDPALLRAGRFDRQVLVDRPDRKGRIDILKVHLKKISVGADLDVDAVAGLTPGFTGADLANLVNEAALVATRRGADRTTLEDFTQAIERLVAGLEKKSRILSPREREIVAHHEMGHALVAMALPGTDPVQKVSIIPRGIAGLGYTMQRPTEDRFLVTEAELRNRMAVLLGGRAAESIVYGDVSTGAADDLAKATDIARGMVTRFGMVPALGDVVYEPETATFLGGTPSWRPRAYGEEAANAIDSAVKELLDRALKAARVVLERNRAVLTHGAQELLAHETLDAGALSKLGAELSKDPKGPFAIAG
ncbi:MAG TPA: ATP-dependent zinc metalloprotease FtsH [Rhizomicrobium sp.]|nr:ATP-dependent zinc metalloprotease FtsH [Rhizomicrobium sp.]